MSEVIWLPQSVAYTFQLGPALSVADAKTRVTGATIAQADRRLSKAGGAFAQSSQAGALAHGANGYYPCTLSATDTNTFGDLELDVDVAGCLAMRRKFRIVTQETVDALAGSGNGLRSNVMAINSLTASAIRLAISAGRMIPVTISNTGFTPTATEFEFGDYNQAGNDQIKGRVLLFTSGALIDSATRVETYSVSGGRGHVTVVALNAAPANGATALII